MTISCPSCGAIVPEHVPTETRDGRSVRECRRCRTAVPVTEAIL